MQREIIICLLLFPALPAAAAPFCLQRTEAYEFKPLLGNRAVIVTNRSHHKFKVSFPGPCRALEDTSRLGFQTMEQSRLACVEKGDYLVSLRDTNINGFGQSCGVASIEPYTSEMEKVDAVQKAMDSAIQ